MTPQVVDNWLDPNSSTEVVIPDDGYAYTIIFMGCKWATSLSGYPPVTISATAEAASFTLIRQYYLSGWYTSCCGAKTYLTIKVAVQKYDVPAPGEYTVVTSPDHEYSQILLVKHSGYTAQFVGDKFNSENSAYLEPETPLVNNALFIGITEAFLLQEPLLPYYTISPGTNGMYYAEVTPGDPSITFSWSGSAYGPYVGVWLEGYATAKKIPLWAMGGRL